MKTDSYNPWLHGLAWLTTIVALLPIGMGAIVTTVDAGMAFSDWPTSHGQGMLAFPWLKSTGDEFLEHGHRLAGMLIGFITLILAGVAFMTECRAGSRGVVAAILGGVILQGMLGGWRVLADERVIAMLHAIFAAIVFSLMAVLVMMTSRKWTTTPEIADRQAGRRALLTGLVLVVVLAVQYLLGSLLRHLAIAEAWLVHPWFAIVVVLSAGVFLGLCTRTGSRALQRSAAFVVGLIIAQAALGLVTWGVRYGFPQWDIVAVQQSSLQVAVRSLHKALGLLTLLSAVVAVVRLWHLLPARTTRESLPQPVSLAAPQTGGAL